MYDYEHDNSIPEESRQNMDLPRIENAVREILEAIGEDPDREGLQERYTTSIRPKKSCNNGAYLMPSIISVTVVSN